MCRKVRVDQYTPVAHNILAWLDYARAAVAAQADCDDRWTRYTQKGIAAVILKVFVPRGEDFLGIAPGSAIVGSELPNGLIRIDYEGGIHGQLGFESFDRRAMQAAGRH